MADGFEVNNFEHFEDAQQPGLDRKREANGWGFVQEDLVKHHVHMITDVRFVWDKDTPPELRKAFAEASGVLHYIAETAVMRQLEFDKLKPVETRAFTTGQEENGGTVILRDSGWEPIE